MRRLLLPAMILLCAGSALRAQCSIEGRVRLPEPAAAPLPGTRYQIKAGSIAPAPPGAAVVYLEGSFQTAPPAHAVSLVQKGYQFARAVLPVQTGTRVEFPNEDDDYHNVFSYSKTRRFDLGRFRKHETPPAVVFEKPGVVRLYCEIHEHMRGVILVLDTPHFTTTSPAGDFKLAGLPEGNFILKVWLDEKNVLQKNVTLKSGPALRADFGPAIAAR